MIVEDDHPTADLLGRYARLVSCETRISHTGKDAVELATEFLPQIILLDIGLPDIDGWDLAKTLKDQLEPTHPVVIAVTGRTTHDDRMRSKQAGIDHHLNKPSFRKELMELLMQLVGRN